MAKAAQQNIEIEEIETISTESSDPSSSQVPSLPLVSFTTPNQALSKDLSAEKIEKIAHDTGTYQTLQKMRNGTIIIFKNWTLFFQFALLACYTVRRKRRRLTTLNLKPEVYWWFTLLLTYPASKIDQSAFVFL